MTVLNDKTHPLVCATVLGAAILVASTAPAKADAAEATVRHGWTFGVGLGLGEMSAECEGGCEGALASVSVDAHVGFMLNHRLGIVLDLWTLGHPAEAVTLWHTIATVGAQYWVAEKLWMYGGLGGGYLSFDDGDDTVAESETATALTLAGGYVLLQRGAMLVDVQLRAGATLFDDVAQTTVYNSSLSIGASWH